MYHRNVLLIEHNLLSLGELLLCRVYLMIAGTQLLPPRLSIFNSLKTLQKDRKNLMCVFQKHNHSYKVMPERSRAVHNPHSLLNFKDSPKDQTENPTFTDIF